LISNLGSGFVDFFYEPAKGITVSPLDFGKGLVKGTKSLVTKSLSGVMGTASKLTSTLTKIGEKVTFDDDYKRDRAINRQNQAKNIGEGIAFGVRDFGIGLYKGVTGVVLEPIKGAKDEGAKGLLKGIGKGLAGVVLKPTIGAIDIVTRTTEGIKNNALNRTKIRVRPPRHVGPDRVLNLYNPEKAIGQEIFKTLRDGRYRKEYFLYHLDLPEDTMVIVSDKNLYFCDKSYELGRKWIDKWRVDLQDIYEINKEDESYHLILQIYIPKKRKLKEKLIVCYEKDYLYTLNALILQALKSVPNSILKKGKEDIELKFFDNNAKELDVIVDKRNKEKKSK